MIAKTFTPLGTVILASLFRLTAQAMPVDEHRLLAAIAQVETGTRNLNRPSKKVGRSGERSAWQITETVWRQYTRTKFVAASTDARLANTIAALHLRTLSLTFEAHGILPTPYRLAVAWNAGASAAIENAVGPRTHDYAQRVTNLYHER